MTSMAADVALDQLDVLVKERAKIEARIADLVFEAREAGGWAATPWDEIAKVLGVSRQAAMKRYAAMCEERGDWKHRRRCDAGGK